MNQDANAALLATYGGRSKTLPQALTLDHVSPATRLLEKRRQMFEVQEALDAQKEEFARREDAFRRREEALRKKDLELQESLIKFNKFLQENESKRNRAVKRAGDERKQRDLKESEIARLQDQHRLKLEEEKALQRQLRLNEKYQRFLADVVDHGSDDYHEIQDLLNRFKTLKGANRDLAENQRKHEQENEDMRIEFAHFKKERQNEMLNQNNDIKKMQKALEKRETAVRRLQNEVDSTIRGTSDKALELGQVLRSVRNLLERFEKHMQAHSRKGKMVRRPERPIGNSVEELQATSKQAIESLDEICLYMLDYRAIVDEFLDHDRHQRRLQTHTGGAAAAATPPGPHTVAFSVSEGGKE